MKINEHYKMESDTLNVTLYHRNTGRKKWQPIAYFSNPHNALEYLVKHEIMGTGLSDFKTVIEKIKELERLIRTLKGLPDLAERGLDRPKDNSRGKLQAQGVML